MNHKEIERWYRLRNLKRAAQILVIASVVFVIAGYVTSRLFIEPPKPPDSVPDSDGRLRVENFSYSHPGVYPLVVKASVAIVPASLDSVVLNEPSVTVTAKDGKKVILTAQKGKLERTDGYVSASGRVTVRYGDLILKTGEIAYSDSKRMVWTDSTVSVEGRSFHFEGKGLKVLLETEELIIERDIQATLFGSKWLLSNEASLRTRRERIP